MPTAGLRGYVVITIAEEVAVRSSDQDEFLICSAGAHHHGFRQLPWQ
jgi:hypothetical protein